MNIIITSRLRYGLQSPIWLVTLSQGWPYSRNPNILMSFICHNSSILALECHDNHGLTTLARWRFAKKLSSNGRVHHEFSRSKPTKFGFSYRTFYSNRRLKKNYLLAGTKRSDCVMENKWKWCVWKLRILDRSSYAHFDLTLEYMRAIPLFIRRS